MSKSILDVLIGVGMKSSLPKLVRAGPPEVLPVLLDGRVIGSLASGVVPKVVSYLRRLKVSATSLVCLVRFSSCVPHFHFSVFPKNNIVMHFADSWGP